MANPFSKFSDSSAFISLAYQGMQSIGIDADAVYRRLGVDQVGAVNRHSRIPHEAQVYFWAVLEEVSQDDYIGLHLGQSIPVMHGQVLQYLFLSSASFGDGLLRALNYQRLLSDASVFRFNQDESGTYLSISHASPAVSKIRHSIECLVVSLIRFFKHVTNDQFKPTQVGFKHTRDGLNLEEYQHACGCEVLFEHSEHRIYFSPACLSIVSLHAEPDLLVLHEKLASEQVAKLERQDIVVHVYQALGEILESGDVSLHSVAAKLGLKVRTLRTYLSSANTSFNQLLANYRCTLAKKLLTNTEESIDHIVYLTGFSEPSTFYRAFKRWTGLTPIDYRKNKQSLAHKNNSKKH